MKVKVPDIPGPVVRLCYKQDPVTLARCDRQGGHGGDCLWKLAAKLKKALAESAKGVDRG